MPLSHGGIPGPQGAGSPPTWADLREARVAGDTGSAASQRHLIRLPKCHSHNFLCGPGVNNGRKLWTRGRVPGERLWRRKEGAALRT